VKQEGKKKRRKDVKEKNKASRSLRAAGLLLLLLFTEPVLILKEAG
jgi:hypothetical protein